ncbi:hypothetical protein ACFXG1_02495 [Streptomyces sp. NPDC059248]|uniref:hypothetical protein n=1 Tax=Streptomyces sp. NPDC059248 TaxID=3346791 RepID=UPI0036998FB9
MTLESLLAEPRPVVDAVVCGACGRETAAPVEVRPGVVACPEHVLDVFENRVVAR